MPQSLDVISPFFQEGPLQFERRAVQRSGDGPRGRMVQHKPAFPIGMPSLVQPTCERMAARVCPSSEFLRQRAAQIKEIKGGSGSSHR